MKLLGIKKYINIYKKLLKFGLITMTTYRVSFFVELFVELGYQISYIFFYKIIFNHIHEIAGWTYYEMLLLSGFDMIIVELLFGLICIENLRHLPRKITNGNLDIILTKPINSLFSASLFSPYLMSILSSLNGIFIIFYAGSKLNINLTLIGLASFFIAVISGFIIAYSILVIFASLSFVFINAGSVPIVGEKIVFFSSNPHQVYRGILKAIFFFIFPVVFISSIPSSTLIHGVDIKILLTGIGLAAIFLTIAIKVWNRMIRFYSSASS